MSARNIRLSQTPVAALAEPAQEMGYSVCQQKFGEQTSVIASLQAGVAIRFSWTSGAQGPLGHPWDLGRVAMLARAP